MLHTERNLLMQAIEKKYGTDIARIQVEFDNDRDGRLGEKDLAALGEIAFDKAGAAAFAFDAIRTYHGVPLTIPELLNYLKG